jgi:hypothetical protein
VERELANRVEEIFDRRQKGSCGASADTFGCITKLDFVGTFGFFESLLEFFLFIIRSCSVTESNFRNDKIYIRPEHEVL